MIVIKIRERQRESVEISGWRFEVVDLIEGFRQAGLEFVLTKHETAAAFMAEATATLTGTPGVCLATLGPGATNLVTGVAHAYLDRRASQDHRGENAT